MIIRPVGMHLRLEDTYSGILNQAKDLGLNSCQFFLLWFNTGKYPRLTKEEKKAFLKLRREHFSKIYIHGSYWINPSTGMKVSQKASRRVLKKELMIAKQLEVNYLVLHAGTAKGFQKTSEKSVREQGIEALAQFLNVATSKENPIQILIENTAHAGKAIGSNLQDFVILRRLLHYPERIGFCIDTSHAFSYGYSLEDTEKFAGLLDQTMGLKNIKLIHLNDSDAEQGSNIDKHALPGEGKIGKKALMKFINHEAFKNIPIILEPPSVQTFSETFLESF